MKLRELQKIKKEKLLALLSAGPIEVNDRKEIIFTITPNGVPKTV